MTTTDLQDGCIPERDMSFPIFIMFVVGPESVKGTNEYADQSQEVSLRHHHFNHTSYLIYVAREKSSCEACWGCSSFPM